MSAIGFFGGTFDPIHCGHLCLAQEVSVQLGLQTVRFVPSGTPPHRVPPKASAAHRLAMVEAAIADNPRFVVDASEVHKREPCYTVDSLQVLRQSLGATQPLVLLMGADAFLELATWSRWHQLFTLAHIAVAYRPGFPVDTWQARMPQPLAAEYNARLVRQPQAIHWSPAGGVVVTPITALDVAATRIRDMMRQDGAARYLVTDKIYQYIQEHKLYMGD